jgi:hypothetical protein
MSAALVRYNAARRALAAAHRVDEVKSTLLHGSFLAATAREFRPGRVSKTKRHSTYITKQQAMNLMEALKFADTIGYPLNVSIDIFWEMFSRFTDDRTRLARLQERLSKWCARRGFPLTMAWVREIGKNGGRHTHILIHVPPWLMEDVHFETELKQELEQALEPEGGPTHEKAIKVQPAPSPEGKLRYMLKGMRRRDADQLDIRRASFQGELEGKRVGWTENIGQRARRRFEASSSGAGEDWSDLPANTPSTPITG